MATPRVAAGAIFFDEHGCVLLVRPAYKPHWDIPGGYVEPRETPLEACQREIQEELGIKPLIGRLLVVDWAPNPGEGDKILLVFDAGVLNATDQTRIRLDPTEISEFQFCSPDDFDQVLVPRLARRVRAACAARMRSNFAYLEHGSPQPSTSRFGTIDPLKETW
jgi:8-oxo-dGTP diphosphatase